MTTPTDDELRGQRFGRLTIGARAPSYLTNANRRFHCTCDCGCNTIATFSNLKSGKIVSCGCFALERARSRATHGHTRQRKPTREYRTWTQMISRCGNVKHHAYQRYGGRGIRVCERWRGAGGFERFLADMGERPDGTSIDRIDVNGNYEPGNCRWATAIEQNRNTSRSKLTASGVSAIRKRLAAGEAVVAIARDLGISHSHVSHIKSGKAWGRATAAHHGLVLEARR